MLLTAGLQAQQAPAFTPDEVKAAMAEVTTLRKELITQMTAYAKFYPRDTSKPNSFWKERGYKFTLNTAPNPEETEWLQLKDNRLIDARNTAQKILDLRKKYGL